MKLLSHHLSRITFRTYLESSRPLPGIDYGDNRTKCRTTGVKTKIGVRVVYKYTHENKRRKIFVKCIRARKSKVRNRTVKRVCHLWLSSGELSFTQLKNPYRELVTIVFRYILSEEGQKEYTYHEF